MKRILPFTLLFSACLRISVTAQLINHWETAVYNNDIWKYLVGISEPGHDWRLLTFNDAFVAYLNDVEIARVGISGVHPAYNQTGNDHEATMYRNGPPESFVIDKKKLSICLLPGENILAVQVHNSTSTSSDLTANVFLSFGITNNSSDYRPVPSWFSPLVVFTSSNLPKVLRLPATKAIRF